MLVSIYASPGVLHAAPPSVGGEGVVGLVGEGGTVLVQPPHVTGDVQVKLGTEVDLQQTISWVQSTQSVVDLVVRPLLVQAGHHPGAIQDGHQVP